MTAPGYTPRPAVALDPSAPLADRLAALAAWWDAESTRLLAARPGDSDAVVTVRRERAAQYSLCADDLRAVLAADPAEPGCWPCALAEDGQPTTETIRQAWREHGAAAAEPAAIPEFGPGTAWGRRITIYGPHCSHEDCSWITCGETGLVEFACRKPGCPHCGAPAATEPEHWAGDPARVAAMSAEDRARVAAYLAKYPMVSRGPDDNAERLNGAEPEPDEYEDYDPGPEVDDEGGMSEYAQAEYPTEGDPS
jgi:hypothetical protein